MDFKPEGVPGVPPLHVEVTGHRTVVHNYRFFYYLANEMAYRAQKVAEQEDAVALDEYRYSIASVIFSFTYVEGYVNHLMYAPDSTVQDLFSGMSKKLRQGLEYLPLTERIEYLAFHHPRSKNANLNRGREPYQSFILLTKLRHFLIHYKPEEEVTLASSKDYQKAFEKLERQVTGRFVNLPGFIGGSVNGLRPVVVGGVHCIRCSRLLRTLLVERRRSDGGCDGC